MTQNKMAIYQPKTKLRAFLVQNSLDFCYTFLKIVDSLYFKELCNL